MGHDSDDKPSTEYFKRKKRVFYLDTIYTTVMSTSKTAN